MIFVILTSISGVSIAKVFYEIDIGATETKEEEE